MRRAGFDMLFIGVESFSRNSLLETAKVQNLAPDMVRVVRKIQSYGFIVVAGLIFGFDSDDETCFETMLQGLKDSALLSGDPSLLTALPGDAALPADEAIGAAQGSALRPRRLQVPDQH